jgi:hypothetical protein
MRIATKPGKETDHRFVQHGVIGNRAFEILELLFLRQAVVQQQEADFQVRTVLGQLIDRVTAVLQHTGIAVEEGDRAGAGGRGHESGVVGEITQLLVEAANIDHLRPRGWCVNRQGDFLSRAVVSNRYGFVAHWLSSKCLCRAC